MPFCPDCLIRHPPSYKARGRAFYSFKRGVCANKGNKETPCKGSRGLASPDKYRYCTRCSEVYSLCQICGKKISPAT